jgi:hypothetical protein
MCPYAEYHSARCRYAECRRAEFRGAVEMFGINGRKLSIKKQIVFSRWNRIAAAISDSYVFTSSPLRAVPALSQIGQAPK